MRVPSWHTTAPEPRSVPATSGNSDPWPLKNLAARRPQKSPKTAPSSESQASAGAPAGAHSVAYVATRKERGLLIFALVTYAVMQQLRRMVSDKH